jgi:hypothetical protein
MPTERERITPTAARRPAASLPGPSRTITVEPLRQPARRPAEPAPPPPPRPERDPRPEREPVPAHSR